LEAVINPILLYTLLGVGGLGVLLALPREKVNPQAIGALIAAAGFGGIFLALGLKAGSNHPGLFFYLFALIALGSGLRVITHPKPVYSALYFIMTVLSSSALFLMLGAEFMAFALIIIYAGAILITYLFVIMLATQAPSEEDLETLSEYDAYSREPAMATAVGFAVLALLTGMMAKGAAELAPSGGLRQSEALLTELPGKAIDALDRHGVFDGGALVRPDKTQAAELIDPVHRVIMLEVKDAEALRRLFERSPLAASLLGSEERVAALKAGSVNAGDRIEVKLPADVVVSSVDGVGWDLIAKHPMGLELAGVILLMAMLGAVVLARKQIEMGEAEKLDRVRSRGGEASGVAGARSAGSGGMAGAMAGSAGGGGGAA